MQSFSTVYELVKDIINASTDMILCQWRMPEQVDLNVGDWEEIRMYAPGCHVASNDFYGMPVQTWSGLRHNQFRLRIDGQVVHSRALV